MITAVEGKPGQGKSVYLVDRVLYYLNKGYYVVTNIHVQVHPRHRESIMYFEEWEEINFLRLEVMRQDNKKLKGIKLVVDELQVFLNSRQWDKLDVNVQYMLQQHRKRGMDIFGACQSINRADVVFRELIQEFYGIRKVFTTTIFRRSFGLFYLVQFDEDTIGSSAAERKRVGWPFIFIADPSTMAAYSTTEEYLPANPVGRKEIHTIIYEEKSTIAPRVVNKQRVEDAPAG